MVNMNMKSYIDQCKLAHEAKKKFLQDLWKLGSEYERLWNENLELVKFINNGIKSNLAHPLNLIEIENLNSTLSSSFEKENEPSKFSETLISNVNLNPSTRKKENSVIKNVSAEFNSDMEDVLEKSKNLLEDRMSKSPIISKHRRRRKKTSKESFVESDINDSFEFNKNINVLNAELEANSNNSIEINTHEKISDKTADVSIINSTIFSDTEDTDNDIRFIKKSNICRKLILNKTGTEKLEISPCGRRLKQSKLVLQKLQKKEDSIFSLEEDFSTNWDNQLLGKSQISHSPELCQSYNLSQDIDNDNIVLTPIRSFKRKSKLSLSSRNFKNESTKFSSQKNDSAKLNPKDSYFIIPNSSQLPEVTNQASKKKVSTEKNETFNETNSNDETFFSPGERPGAKQNKTEDENIYVDNQFPVLCNEKNPVIPYIGKTVRGKRERAQLEGWDCYKCQEFYEGMGYTEEELKKFKKNCSRHRSKFDERFNTPAGFWNPEFSHSNS